MSTDVSMKLRFCEKMSTLSPIKKSVRATFFLRLVCCTMLHCGLKAILFLHYTTKHTERLRQGLVRQPGLRHALIVTVSLQQSRQEIHQITFYMSQIRTSKPQKPLIRKHRDVSPNKNSGAIFGVLRSISMKDNRIKIKPDNSNCAIKVKLMLKE